MRPIQERIWWQVVYGRCYWDEPNRFLLLLLLKYNNERKRVYKYAFDMAFHSFSLGHTILTAYIQLYMARFDSMLKSCYLISIALTIELNACLFLQYCTGLIFKPCGKRRFCAWACARNVYFSKFSK